MIKIIEIIYFNNRMRIIIKNITNCKINVIKMSECITV